MHGYDDVTVRTAAAAFREALYHVEAMKVGVDLTQDGANLAVAIGITSSAALGQTTHLDMLLSGLNHMAIAYGEHSQGIDPERLPTVRTEEHYRLHAELLRAMAEVLKNDDCSVALDQCAKAFDRIARSQELLAAPLLRLCRVAEGNS